MSTYSSLAAPRCILFTLEMFSEQYKNKHAHCSQITDCRLKMFTVTEKDVTVILPYFLLSN